MLPEVESLLKKLYPQGRSQTSWCFYINVYINISPVPPPQLKILYETLLLQVSDSVVSFTGGEKLYN